MRAFASGICKAGSAGSFGDETARTHPFETVKVVLLCADERLGLHTVGDLLPRRRVLPCAVLLEKRDEVLALGVAVDRVDLSEDEASEKRHRRTRGNETYVLDHRLDKLVDREERVRLDAAHVPQVLLVRLLVEVAVKELLGEVESVLIVVLSRVLPLVDDRDRRRETQFNAERTEATLVVGSLLRAEPLEVGEAVVERLRSTTSQPSACSA